MRKIKIAVAGTGYVGLSMAVLLSQHNTVTAVDILPEKVDLINNRKSPISDPEIEEYLSGRDLDLVATTDGVSAYREADFVVISTPTNYDPKKNYFDTSSVEAAIDIVREVNPDTKHYSRSKGYGDKHDPVMVLFWYIHKKQGTHCGDSGDKTENKGICCRIICHFFVFLL